MAVLIAVVVGFLAGRLTWLMLRPTLAAPVFARDNYRGLVVPTAGGLVVAVAMVTVEAVRSVAAVALGDSAPAGDVRTATIVLVLGLALLGIVDDLAGGGDSRGFRGHLRVLGGGELTTGGLKLLGGAAVCTVSVALARPSDALGLLVADAALVALAANLANLFDRAPGRTIKVGGAAFAVIVVAAAGSPSLVPVAIVVAAALSLLLDDLHERVMLGDTGANVLGGALGLAVVVTASPAVRLATLAVLVVLNGISEWVSFSRVIDAVPPLRVIDRAGRRGP